MRVSVTELADYRRFRNTDQTFEQWLARWKRLIPPTPAMRAGTRFHRFLETGGRDYADRVEFKLDFTPKEAIKRVELRVRQGGHPVPEPVIRRRFHAGLRNFKAMYRPCVDDWLWYNNSGMRPLLLEKKES